MSRWLKGAVLLVLLAVGLEAGSWLMLTLWFGVRPTDNPRVAEYMRRGHPLLTDNEDLRAGEIGVELDTHLGYRLRKNYTYPRINPQSMSIIETDAAGFVHNGDRQANPRLLADPAAKAYRILMLGCSSVFGAGTTTNAATLPARLEARLKTRWPGVPIHVINAGVLGYQSTQARLSYELYLRRLKPDAVIHITGNCDAKYSTMMERFTPHWSPGLVVTRDSYLDHFRPGPAFRIFLANLNRFPEPLYSLAVLRRLAGRFGGGDAPPAPPTYYFHPEAVMQFGRNIEGLARGFVADGVLGLFAMQPHLGTKKANLGEFERQGLKANKEWIKALQRHLVAQRDVFARLSGRYAGLPLRFVDFSDAFDGVDETTYQYWTHFNDLGNEVMAERLEQRFGPALEADLATRGWLKP
jgi:hypothetical protein